MAKIINLNKVKKQKAKTDKKAKAAENLRRFGLNKAEKHKNKAERNAGKNKLNGLRLYRPEDNE